MFGFLLATSCDLAKKVPEGKYLLKKNKIEVKGDKIETSSIEDIIKQKPNRSLLGVKSRLWMYNQDRFLFMKMDSVTIAKIIQDKKNKRLKINARRLVRQERMNRNRRSKARKKGEKYYYQKIVPLKDTTKESGFLRYWLKYKFGEPPVIVDTNATLKTLQSVRNYMMKKGYFESSVSATLDTIEQKRQIKITYLIETKSPYIIDSLKSHIDNPDMKKVFPLFISRIYDFRLKGQNLDSDLLNQAKAKLADFFKNQGFYGFSPNSITIEVDTTLGNHRAAVDLYFNKRKVNVDGEIIEKEQSLKVIRNVYFDLNDTINKKENYLEEIDSKGINLNKEHFLPTFDTTFFAKIKYKKRQLKKLNLDPKIDSLNPNRMVYVTYNGRPYLRPIILESQNFLEKETYYKEYLYKNSITRLSNINVFQTIKPEIIEVPDTNLIDVHYHLVPYKKQSFSLEPRFTNSNGYLGLNLSLSYVNRNLFHGGENLTISFSGGLESNPPVFGDNAIDGTNIVYKRTFNTFEFGPTIKLDLPGLFPLPINVLAKSIRPLTTIALSYNNQHRPDFNRESVQLEYIYKFDVAYGQNLRIGLPFTSVIKYVNITKDAFFEQKLQETNDLFLRNAYSNQLIWEDFKIVYETNNFHSYKRKKGAYLYRITVNHAGLLPSWLSKGVNAETGQKTIFNVAYSQFIRLDNEFIGEYIINRKSSFHYRLLAGAGLPYGNIATSLPYDYSFYAGGSNDNRGWAARTLGPGSYKYYLDENRTITQIGDIRLGVQAEYRFSITNLFKFAFFVDANNIWTLNEDVNRPGSKFSKDFIHEIALSPGLGLRLDFSFFVVRVDVGVPFTNPALPRGSRWIFQSRQPYYDEGIAVFGEQYKSKMPRPFVPSLQFGIGYPF